VITSFDGKEITEMRFLPRMVAETKIGKTVSVTYWRKGASKTTQITLGELDESADEADPDSATKGKKGAPKKSDSQTVLGMEVLPLTPQVREELHIDDKQAGLAVVDVKSGSEAAKRGIEAGDVVADVNNEPVKTPEDLKKAFDNAKKAGRKFALVKIWRDKEVAYITLPTSEDKKAEEKKEKAK
jgi:serine protease Do